MSDRTENNKAVIITSSAEKKGLVKVDHQKDAQSKSHQELVQGITEMMKIMRDSNTTEDQKKRIQRKLDAYGAELIARNPNLKIDNNEDVVEHTMRVLSAEELKERRASENLFNAEKVWKDFLKDIDLYIGSLERNNLTIAHPRTGERVSADQLKESRQNMVGAFDLIWKKTPRKSIDEVRKFWNVEGREFLLDAVPQTITSAGEFRKKFKDVVNSVINEIMK